MQTPPNSLDAEKSTLGCVLADQNTIIKILDGISPDDFYYRVNQYIYESMVGLFNSSQPIDIITLSNDLSEKGKLEEIGGSGYIASLVEHITTPQYINQYATIVKKKSTLRRLLKAGHQIMTMGHNQEEDVELLLEEAEKSLFSVSQKFSNDNFDQLKDFSSNTFEKVVALHDPNLSKELNGIKTGYENIDKILYGLNPSDLFVLAARPSMGKTALALNFAKNMADNGKHVAIVSLEMSKDQLMERLFCSLLGVEAWKIKEGKLDDYDFARMGAVMDKLNSYNIYIDDSLGSSISELRARARRLQSSKGLDVLIIDYLQLMQGSKANFGNRNQEIAEISRGLKSLARELKIPIIALSQLSRAVELRSDKVPHLADLRDSGAIEQDADVVMMLYRDDYYDPQSSKKGLVEAYIRKNRNGGLGVAKLDFDRSRMVFKDVRQVVTQFSN